MEVQYFCTCIFLKFSLQMSSQHAETIRKKCLGKELWRVLIVDKSTDHDKPHFDFFFFFQRNVFFINFLMLFIIDITSGLSQFFDNSLSYTRRMYYYHYYSCQNGGILFINMYKYTTCLWILNFVFQCVYFYWLCEIK